MDAARISIAAILGWVSGLVVWWYLPISDSTRASVPFMLAVVATFKEVAASVLVTFALPPLFRKYRIRRIQYLLARLSGKKRAAVNLRTLRAQCTLGEDDYLVEDSQRSRDNVLALSGISAILLEIESKHKRAVVSADALNEHQKLAIADLAAKLG